MAPTSTHPLLGDSPPFQLEVEAADKALLASLPYTTLDGVVALHRAIQDDFASKAIPSAVKKLPGRRVHELRPHMEAIARILYQHLSRAAQPIHYEASRKTACGLARFAEKEELARREALAQGFRAQDLQGPWAGQDADPVSLAGPRALPMPVQIGEPHHFRACFDFLAANQDPNDFWPGGAKAPKDAGEFKLDLGNELMWNTPLVEFESGAVYSDRRLDLCKGGGRDDGGTAPVSDLKTAAPKDTDESKLRGGRLGHELIWDTPLVEFDKGAVYTDRRLDLCKGGGRDEDPAMSVGDVVAKASQKLIDLKLGHELVWDTPLVEFDKGAVYTDRRLDLCKGGGSDSGTATPTGAAKVLGPTNIGRLMDALRSNDFVTHFLLGNNVISARGAAAITAFLEDKPHQMETWYLAGNHLKTAGFVRLAAAMAPSTSITNVWLKRNPLGPGAVDALAQLILQTKHLRTLDLENTELGDAGIARLFEQLKGKPMALKNIYLNANGLGTKGTTALAAALEAGWQAESLMLASNPIGDAGARPIAAALRTNTSVVRLGLSSCGLTSAGIALLADALAAHPTVRSVVLAPLLTTAVHGQRYNHIADAAVPALGRLIANPGLRVLELGRTALSPAAVEALRDAVAASALCAFQAHHPEPPAGGLTCALRVRQALEANVRRHYGTDLGTFQRGLGLRFLRNTPDVRLIDSVYRTRDKRKGAAGVKQFWDAGDPVWAMVDADWDAVDAEASGQTGLEASGSVAGDSE